MLGLSRLLVLQFLNEQVFIINKLIGMYVVLTLTYTGARMGKNLRKYATAILLDQTSLIGHLNHVILKISDVIITFFTF